MKRVFNFSGGKSSAMACLVSDPQPDDIILFDDTGREHPLTYKFIEDFERNEGLKVHTAAYQHHKSPGLLGFDALNQHRVYLPNRVRRICTEELKIKTTSRYLRSIGITPKMQLEQIIGFRADEEHRVLRFKSNWKKNVTKFPLYEMGINKAMVMNFGVKNLTI
jgi:3'-phosphoadenosine 5'-phosphosulfate sulfotransferase (PAPS reductase)/FAD synthetase